MQVGVFVLVTMAIVQVVLYRGGSEGSGLWGDRSLPDFWSLPSPIETNPKATIHPIETLMRQARAAHNYMIETHRSYDVATAAARYRERRGRHPPPGFDHWVEAALKSDAVLVESFFDRIYHDLNPFWALDPKTTARRARNWHHVVRVRNGTAEGVGDVEGRVPWLQLWTELVAEAAQFLPDVDMPINYMDESRLLVPSQEIAKLVGKEQATRQMPPTEKVITRYTGLREIDTEADHAPYDPKWISSDSRRYWDYMRKACPPDSPSHSVPALDNFARPPSLPAHWRPEYSYEGFVQNFTASRDPCIQPHLRGLHGTFIEPLSMSTAEELIPLFGGCKLPVNNEILIPGAMYLTADPFYSGGDSHGPQWQLKRDAIVWRGVASGGRNKRENWTHFHRHRLVEMLNGTTVTAMEKSDGRAMTFDLPPPADEPGRTWYASKLRERGKLGEWLKTFADAGFVRLLCFPKESNCDYISEHFSEVEPMPMKKQYEAKFLPDADGNSFSARFRGFMLSTSLPLKATIYSEWHDDRLVPWLHFVPLDNTFQDLYSVLEYFAAPDEHATNWTRTTHTRGDAAARWIAEEGKRWAEKVLRREDMRLYVWRLLLEFARVCDVQRDHLGYVEDLLAAGGAAKSG